MTRRIGTLALLAPLAGALLVTSAAAQLVAIEIAPGETITGMLDAKDFRLDDDSFYECYVVYGTPGSSVQLTMRSATFDTVLFALSTNLDHCQQVQTDDGVVMDDDGGGGPNGTDSQLTLTFDANGRFLIVANSYAAGTTGEYTLTAEAVAGGGGGFAPPKGPGAAAAPPPPTAPPAPALK